MLTAVLGFSHLRLKTYGGALEWSVRLRAPERARTLRPEQVGTSHAVLAHGGDEPLAPAFRTLGDESRRVRVVCVCGAEPHQACTCSPPPRETTARDLDIHGFSEGSGRLRLPSRALVVVEPAGPVRWSLQQAAETTTG